MATVKYSGELLATPVVDLEIMQSLSSQTDAGSLLLEMVPTDGEDIIREYFLSLAKDGTLTKNWIKKQVPAKPGQPHIGVPPLPPGNPPRQPPSSDGGLNCPAVSSSK